MITSISDQEYNDIISKSEKYEFKNKYDLFYFITEHLNKQKLLKAKNIIIYENFYLDEYTRDFIKYIVKEVVVPAGADKAVFFLAPMISFTLAVVAWSVIPFNDGWVLADLNVAILIATDHKRFLEGPVFSLPVFE